MRARCANDKQSHPLDGRAADGSSRHDIHSPPRTSQIPASTHSGGRKANRGSLVANRHRREERTIDVRAKREPSARCEPSNAQANKISYRRLPQLHPPLRLPCERGVTPPAVGRALHQAGPRRAPRPAPAVDGPRIWRRRAGKDSIWGKQWKNEQMALCTFARRAAPPRLRPSTPKIRVPARTPSPPAAPQCAAGARGKRLIFSIFGFMAGLGRIWEGEEEGWGGRGICHYSLFELHTP
ncbi:unnamed protein product [Urochloa humidicola]